MLPFQNTSVYKEATTFFQELLKEVEEQQNIAFKNKLQEEMLGLTASIAKILSEDNRNEQEKSLKKLNFSGLFAILEIMEKNKIISPEKQKNFCKKLENLEGRLHNFQKSQKNILILSMSAGQGHMSAAKATKEGLEYTYGYDNHIEIVDFSEILNSTMSKAGIKVYEGSIKYAPSIYEFFFESTNKKWQIKFFNLLNYPFNFNKLKKFFQEKQPDVILSTFPLWDYIALKIWKKQNPQAKFLSMITDSILVHKAWITADTDYHIVANKDTATSLKEVGIRDSKIKILGFPVKLNFLEKTDRQSFLQSYSLDPEILTIMFLATSEKKQKAIKTIEEILKTTKKFNLIIITGKNTKLKHALIKYEHLKNIRVLGWTDQVANFIKSSDMVITKAGGATVMECIAAKKPMIITQIVPGQEQGNAELIKRYQLGIVLESNTMNITESIDFIEKNSTFLQKNLAKLSRPKAALEIAEFLHEIMKS